ncbi:hypothetical protein GE09DRAFT_1249688 [Coniochaeta sp. 2T2.1]|nr:hypothetical protein GE09DRAFT_1249688 [Coniochaeta sp. 2T2.1]
MTFVTNPTYLLAPNWNFPFDGPIALAPATVTVIESNWRLELERIRSVNLSLWTKILELANLGVGSHRSKATTVIHKMSKLETIYFRHEPSVEDIAVRTRERRVRAVLETRKWGRRGAVYMVSGLKIARGFRLDRVASSDKGLEIGAGTRHAGGFEADNDIVFAYQLLRIRLQGRGENATLKMEEFHDNAAFLTEDGDEKEEKVEAGGQVALETDGASLVDLAETQRELTVNPADDQYAWLFPS